MATKFINPIRRESTTSQFLDNNSADLKFAFEVDNAKKFLPAHKSVLAQSSSVFRNMFFCSVPETEVTITISDASHGEFEEFLQFFYQKEVELTMQNIEGVVRLADKYDVVECSDICAEFLESHVTFDNLFLIHHLAATFNVPKLKMFCESKIQYSTLEMFNSPAFLECTKDMLNSILLMDELACTETHIFEAYVAWAKNSCRKNELDDTEARNVRQQLGDILYLIRFRAMTGEEIVQIMTNQFYARMFSHKELIDVLCLRNVKDFESDIFCPKTRINLSLELNQNPVMSCTGGVCYRAVIQNESKVFFQSTVPALLIDFRFYNIPVLSGLKFTITITEDGVPEILFHGSVTYRSPQIDLLGPKLSLPNVLAIKPNTLYRISIATEINGNMPIASFGTLDTSEQMKDIPLRFVNDPSKPPPPSGYRNVVETSIVKAMHFKPITTQQM